MNVVTACHIKMAFMSSHFFLILLFKMDKINKIKIKDVTYEIGSNVDMSQYQTKAESVKIERLTQAEYDALSTKDNNTLYIITDAQ